MNQLSSMTRHAPRQNGLLAALPKADYERLSASLELVPLPLGRAVYESGGQLDYAYFPTDCIVSLLSVTQDGSSAEIAIAGNEGLVGIALFMGGETTSSRAVVQNAGYAYRVPAALIKQEFDRGGALQLLAAALHAGAHHADVADRGLQPAPFVGAAALPLAAAERGPAALEQAGDDRGADRQHARRAAPRGSPPLQGCCRPTG